MQCPSDSGSKVDPQGSTQDQQKLITLKKHCMVTILRYLVTFEGICDITATLLSRYDIAVQTQRPFLCVRVNFKVVLGSNYCLIFIYAQTLFSVDFVD